MIIYVFSPQTLFEFTSRKDVNLINDSNEMITAEP